MQTYWSKLQFFNTSHVFNAHTEGDPDGILERSLVTREPERWHYRVVKNFYGNFSCFDTTLEMTGQSAGHFTIA